MPASITLTVSHLPTSTSFFLSTLQPLSYVYRGRVNDTIGFGLPDAAPDFWITQSIPGVPPGPAHVAFPATSRGNVHDFFHAALKAGAKVHGEPALRDECGYYSAAVIDFDGNSIEAVFRPDLIEADAGDTKSVASMTKSAAKSKAPTVVSSASKARSTAPSKAPSAAPSAAKSTVSRVPSAAPSKAPSQAARSVATSAVSATPAKTTVSRAPTATPSQAPARTTLSRAPTAPAAPQGPGNNISDMMAEARGTINFAREMVNSVRQSVSPPQAAAQPAGGAAGTSPDSHGPSDAIVGTLLGVAAGAALHYAFSSRGKSNGGTSASAPVTPPDYAARSETAPSYTEERYYYYHQQEPQYQIEPAGSDYSRASGTRHSGQRLIEMVDNDPAVFDVVNRRGSVAGTTTTARPRRRSSFSAVGSRASRAPSGAKLLEGPPPTSYRGPTVMTSASSHASRRTRSSSTSRAGDEGYGSATETRRAPKSSASAASGSTTKPRSHASKAPSNHTVITAIKTPDKSSSSEASFHSSHSKQKGTVIGRLTEKQLHQLEAGGRLKEGQTDVTRSVIGKVKEVDRLDVSRREIGPDDSISQVSSVRSGGSRRSRK